MNLFEAWIPASLVVLLGSLILDLLLGEPPEFFHPVVWMGRMIDSLKERFGGFDNRKVSGSLVALTIAFGSGGLTYLLLEFIIVVWKPLALLAGIYLMKSTISIRSLLGVARKVGEKIESDSDLAREELLALVGRDRSDLSRAEMRSATIESLFENLVDSVITPYFYFFLGSLVDFKIGVTLAVAYKGINTIDSMLGYRTEGLLDFGSFGARLDDLLNWVPSRFAIWFIALGAFSPRPAVVAFKEWDATPSPNSGWPMAAAAGALKVKLVKRDTYTLGPEYDLPGSGDLNKALSLAGRAIGFYIFLLFALLFLF